MAIAQNWVIQLREIAESLGYRILSSEAWGYKAYFDYLCDEGHARRMRVGNFLNGRKCPVCSCGKRADARRASIDKIRDEFAAEGYVLVSSSYVNTSTNLNVRCPKGHAWSVRMLNWRSGHRCGRCFDHTVINLKPAVDMFARIEAAGYRILDGKGRYVNTRSWLVLECPRKHQYRVQMFKFSWGRRCPECAVIGRADAQRFSLEEVRSRVEAMGYVLLSEKYVDTAHHLLVRCPHGLEYEVLWGNLRRGHRCRCRNPHTSQGEREMRDFVTTLAPDVRVDRTVLEGKELDMYSPSRRVAIEFDGVYWHSDAMPNKDERYHLSKTEAAEAKGIRVLHFFEDEWGARQAIVKDVVSSVLGVPKPRVFARKCGLSVLSVEQRRSFLEANHLQGDARAAFAWGLFYQNELVQVLSVRQAHYTGGEAVWEIARVATKTGLVVVGGLSRLLAGARLWLKGKTDYLYTYADRRYSIGAAYRRVGFEFLGYTGPGFFYCHANKRVHRYNLRKDSTCPEGMTNDEWRALQGWAKIWDCGQLKFRIRV